MNLLLDTHVLVWLAEGREDLSEDARALIDRAAGRWGLVVSAISFWEVAMLAERGKIALSRPILAWRELVLATPGIGEAPVTGDVGVESMLLPEKLHGDPADRMLVATARLNGWQLATRDRQILAYARAGHVDAVRV